MIDVMTLHECKKYASHRADAKAADIARKAEN